MASESISSMAKEFMLAYIARMPLETSPNTEHRIKEDAKHISAAFELIYKGIADAVKQPAPPQN